jgi:hypothetical protein
VFDVQRLDEFGMRTIEIDRASWLLMLDRMHGHELAAYDAVYLSLTESLRAALLTLDARLAAAAGSAAIWPGPKRLAEHPASHDVRPPDVVWARFGAYLAELRREASAG